MRAIGLGLILDAILIAGETAWIYGWCMTVGSWIGGSQVTLLPFSLVVAFLAVPAFLARRAAIARGRKRSLISAFGVLLGAAVVLGVAASDLPLAALRMDPGTLNLWLEGETGGRALLAAGAAAFAWRRGLGRTRPDTSTVFENFGASIVGMSSLLVLVGISGGATRVAPDDLIPLTLLVLVAGLVGMPLARIGEVSEGPKHRHGPGLTMGGPWLVMLLSIVGAILVVTLILARLFTFERIGAVLDAVGGTFDKALMTVIYILAIPFGLLVQLLIFLGRLLIRPGQERPRQPQADPFDLLKDQASAGQISPEFLFYLKVGLGILALLVVVWMMWRAISRLQRMWEEDDVEEERESVWSWPGWGAVWNWLLSRLRPLQKRTTALLFGQAERVRDGDRSIRGLYRQFLAAGASIGHAKQLPETPLEYQQRLGRAAPEGSEEAVLITEAYSLVRYGPPTHPSSDLSRVAEALARLRSIWRERARGH